MKNLFLFCIHWAARATAHTTTCVDNFDTFLEEDCQEEKINTCLFEESCYFSEHTTLERHVILELDEECESHDDWERKCSIARSFSATNSKWESTENFNCRSNTTESESNLWVSFDVYETEYHTSYRCQKCFTSEKFRETSKDDNHTCHYTWDTWANPLTHTHTTRIFRHIFSHKHSIKNKCPHCILWLVYAISILLMFYFLICNIFFRDAPDFRSKHIQFFSQFLIRKNERIRKIMIFWWYLLVYLFELKSMKTLDRIIEVMRLSSKNSYKIM